MFISDKKSYLVRREETRPCVKTRKICFNKRGDMAVIIKTDGGEFDKMSTCFDENGVNSDSR